MSGTYYYDHAEPTDWSASKTARWARWLDRADREGLCPGCGALAHDMARTTPCGDVMARNIVRADQ